MYDFYAFNIFIVYKTDFSAKQILSNTFNMVLNDKIIDYISHFLFNRKSLENFFFYLLKFIDNYSDTNVTLGKKKI